MTENDDQRLVNIENRLKAIQDEQKKAETRAGITTLQSVGLTAVIFAFAYRTTDSGLALFIGILGGIAVAFPGLKAFWEVLKK